MKHKIIKMFVIIILIMIILHMQIPIVYASLAGNAQGESGYQPPPPTPQDSPQQPPSNPGPTDTTPSETRYYYETISGNVSEDLGYTLTGTTDNSDDRKQKMPASGITVLLKQGNSVVDVTVTDSNGNYSFSPPDGTYSTEFWYGDISKINLQNTELVKSALKYNGHDYITVKTPTSKDYVNVEKIEVQKSGKGAAQVFIALDCSYGMRTTEVNVNGQIKTRLQIAADSAKQLINSLINSGENIYVGLLFFSGTNYRAVSLTKNIELLSKALNEIVNNNWYTPNTNILGVLNKAKDSFYNNDKNNSNRYIVLVSDGIPTSDGSTQVYCDESEQETLNKLYNTIGPNTKKKVQDLRKNGINIISLLAKSDESDEIQYVESIFKDTSSIYASIQDGQETIDKITKDMKKYLIDSTEEKEYTSKFSTVAGYEDSTRRKEVDEYFKRFTYKNTIMFEQIETYNASSTSQQKANELSTATKMRVVGGQNYVINHMPPGTPSVEEIKDEETGEVIKKIYHVSTGYSGGDVILAKRPAISLETKITCTGLEIILADGSVLDIQTRNIGSDLPIIKAIDDELTHGATIRVEYSITIKNDSSLQCNYLELINHLPPGFIYSQNVKLITESKQNSDYGFTQVSLQDLYDNGYISEETLNYGKTRVSIKTVLDNNGKGKNGFYIAPGGEYTIKYVASKLISKLDDIEYMNKSIAEVLAYEDEANRRMAYKQNMRANNNPEHEIEILHGVYPGDNKDKDCSTFNNLVYIMPPTGKNENLVIKYIIISAIIFVAIIIFIKIKQT